MGCRITPQNFAEGSALGQSASKNVRSRPHVATFSRARCGLSPAKGFGMSRLILVANRLPVSLDLSDGQVKVQPSAGGLATGMRGLGKQEQTSWVGWPGGAPSNDQQRAEL